MPTKAPAALSIYVWIQVVIMSKAKPQRNLCKTPLCFVENINDP